MSPYLNGVQHSEKERSLTIEDNVNVKRQSQLLAEEGSRRLSFTYSIQNSHYIQYKFTKHSTQARCDTVNFFKWILTGLNSVFLLNRLPYQD